jgi:hypothetical protein
MKIKALILLACLTLTTGLPHQAVFAADTMGKPSDSMKKTGDSMSKPSDSMKKTGDSMSKPSDSMKKTGDSMKK